MAAFALAWVPALLSGQMRVYSDDDDDYSYSSREGLEFGVNIGVYRGFPQAAYFYDGAGDHELSDVGAQIWGIRERLQQLQGQQQQQGGGVAAPNPGRHRHFFSAST